jgi:hypothetical protein
LAAASCSDVIFALLTGSSSCTTMEYRMRECIQDNKIL